MRALKIASVCLATLVLTLVVAGGVVAGGNVYFGVRTEPFYGHEGRVFISLVSPVGGAPIGRVCIPITSDPFEVDHTQLTEMPDNGDPCGPATPQLFTEPGDYVLSGGVYAPGNHTAVRYVALNDRYVDGAFGVRWLSAQLNAFPGDTDCLFNVDVVDALNDLRFVAALAPTAVCIGSGDIDCDEDIDSVDALGILRDVAELPPLDVPEGCPPIGPVTG